MRKAQAIVLPVAILCILLALAFVELQLDAIAEFAFIWDVLLGIALGVGIAILPALAGFESKRNERTSFFWVCGFVSMLLIFCQYISSVIVLRADIVTFLPQANARMRMVEGAFLGYCSYIAARGKM